MLIHLIDEDTQRVSEDCELKGELKGKSGIYQNHWNLNSEEHEYWTKLKRSQVLSVWIKEQSSIVIPVLLLSREE